MNNKIPDNFYEVGDLSLSIFTTHLGLLYAGGDRLYTRVKNLVIEGAIAHTRW
ncbi:hypothetical protein [Nostoc sp.]|uniref:hypothetical protein n=1 Tax=Nostoc sp. TaxID=1180 RepID=UPI002FF6FD2B